MKITRHSRLYILIPKIYRHMYYHVLYKFYKFRSTHQAFSSHCALPPFCPKDARAFALADLLALLLGRPERVRRGRRSLPGRAGKRQESKRGSVGELELNPTWLGQEFERNIPWHNFRLLKIKLKKSKTPLEEHHPREPFPIFFVGFELHSGSKH